MNFSPKSNESTTLPQGKFCICSVGFFTSLPSNYTCTNKEIPQIWKGEKNPTNLSARFLRGIFFFSLPSLLFSTGNSGSAAYSCSQGHNHSSRITSPQCHFPSRHIMKHSFQVPTLFSFPILRSGMLTEQWSSFSFLYELSDHN